MERGQVERGPVERVPVEQCTCFRSQNKVELRFIIGPVPVSEKDHLFEIESA